jgi:hypothetical protein
MSPRYGSSATSSIPTRTSPASSTRACADQCQGRGEDVAERMGVSRPRVAQMLVEAAIKVAELNEIRHDYERPASAASPGEGLELRLDSSQIELFHARTGDNFAL